MRHSNAPIKALDRDHLKQLVDEAIDFRGVRVDLNFIDVSGITDFTDLFKDTQFQGDVSEWNTSCAVSMDGLFENCPFAGDVSNWDVGRVTSASGMFAAVTRRQLTCDFSKWNTASMLDTSGMFQKCQGIKGLESWDVSSVQHMDEMFLSAKCDLDLSRWDVRNVQCMQGMFAYAQGSVKMESWDVSNVQDMKSMFEKSKLTMDLSLWRPTFAKDMSRMFMMANYPGDLSLWTIRPEANIENMLDLNILDKMPNPTVFHWVRLMDNRTLSFGKKQPEWLAHLNEHSQLLDGLGMRSTQAGVWLQQRWLNPTPVFEEHSLPEMMPMP